MMIFFLFLFLVFVFFINTWRHMKKKNKAIIYICKMYR